MFTIIWITTKVSFFVINTRKTLVINTRKILCRTQLVFNHYKRFLWTNAGLHIKCLCCDLNCYWVQINSLSPFAVATLVMQWRLRWPWDDAACQDAKGLSSEIWHWFAHPEAEDTVCLSPVLRPLLLCSCFSPPTAAACILISTLATATCCPFPFSFSRHFLQLSLFPSVEHGIVNHCQAVVALMSSGLQT